MALLDSAAPAACSGSDFFSSPKVFVVCDIDQQLWPVSTAVPIPESPHCANPAADLPGFMECEEPITVLTACEVAEPLRFAAADPSDPETCPHFVVERVQPTGARYPSYSLRLGRLPSPIEDWQAGMEPTELEVLRPLEEVVHIQTPDEGWKLLENAMSPELVARVRSES